MEKVDNKFFNVEVNDEIENYQKELYNKIFNSEYYPILIEQGWKNEEIFNNVTKFKEYIDDLALAKKIKTYSDCVKYNKYQRVVLTLRNNVIEREYVPLKPYADYISYLSHFERRDFNDELINANWSNLKSKVKRSIVENLKQGKRIYLTGAIRSGRTYTAAAVMNAKYTKKDSKIAFVNTPNLISELNNEFFKNKQEFNEDMNLYSTIEILVLDDFGSEYKNEIVRDMMILPILKARATHNLVTVFTSDYSTAEVGQLYSFTRTTDIVGKQLKELLNSQCGEAIVVNEISVY